MDKLVLKKLASLTFEKGKVNEHVQKYVLERLSRNDLKRYVFYLREEMRRTRVQVRLPGAPDAELKKAVEGIFAGKEIEYQTEPSIGAGFQIEYEDNILNLNMRTIIEKTIHGLKESL